MSLIRYRAYNGSGRYKLRHPSFNGKGSFVLGVALTVTEDTSAHVDVTCFDGSDGSVTVAASGGTAPYIYSLDSSFSTYNSTGVFSGLAISGGVEEGTDQYGGIIICHKTIYARDANGRIGHVDVQLKSPVELEWLNPPADMTVHCDSGQNYATLDVASMAVPSTRTNNYYELISGASANNQYPKNQTCTITFEAENDCGEYIMHQFTITVLPNE